MTDQQHPITPPPERFKQWEDDILNERDNVDHVLDCAWKDGFRAGADQELEACCEWFSEFYHIETWTWMQKDLEKLRAARRPKPPSLKEQALALLQPGEPRLFNSEMQAILRRALEALDD